MSVTEIENGYWVQLNDGTIYFQRKESLDSGGSPLSLEEEVIVSFCKKASGNGDD